MADEFEIDDIDEEEKAYVPRPGSKENAKETAPEDSENTGENEEKENKSRDDDSKANISGKGAKETVPAEESNTAGEKLQPEKKKEKLKYDIGKAVEQEQKVDESHLIKTIVVVSDWEEAIQNIIEEENIDPWNVDIVKLVDAFMNYLRNLTKFDFRVPARFIYVAAILLRLKCEALVVRELKQKEEKPSELDINVPLLDMPIMRVPRKKVTITDLISALNKAIDFEERKKDKKMRVRRNVENLIVPVEDIEVRIKRVYEEIFARKQTRFSELVGKWERPVIVEKFIPVLHLSNSGVITCEQNELFGEIFISIRDEEKEEAPVKTGEILEEVAHEAKKEEEDSGVLENQVSGEEMKSKEEKVCETIDAPETHEKKA